MKEIELDLNIHCIETATKRLNNRLLSKYFQSKGKDIDSEKNLELLNKALTCFDFSSLRTAHRELAGESNARITITDNNENPPGITINGRLIDMEPFIKK